MHGIAEDTHSLMLQVKKPHTNENSGYPLEVALSPRLSMPSHFVFTGLELCQSKIGWPEPWPDFWQVPTAWDPTQTPSEFSAKAFFSGGAQSKSGRTDVKGDRSVIRQIRQRVGDYTLAD